MDVISWQRIVVNPTRSVYALITRLYGASNSASPVKQEGQQSPVKMAGHGNRITFDDWLILSEMAFEWADSYDAKDWERLRVILAPTLDIDYTEVNGHKWDAMPAKEFMEMVSSQGFLGDALIHTQHHIGASKWVKVSDDQVIGYHQLRAAHQRYTGPDMQTVENKGHGHAMIKHTYKKIDGEWKFAGLRPTVRWNEFAFDKIFKMERGTSVVI